MKARKWLILCILTFIAFFLLTPLWLRAGLWLMEKMH